MKLSTLLAQDQKRGSGPAVLPTVFGDGYLNAENRLYRRARDLALAEGFRFSSDFNPAYQALPLSQLETLLSAKTIPYTDNVTVLKSIEERIPGQTVWDDITDNLKRQAVFHESCHAFARGQIGGVEPVLARLLEESYANACELLSIIDADDLVHRIFLELNSFVYMVEARVHLVRAERELGLEGLLRFMTLSYLHANFLRDSVDVEACLRLSVKTKIEGKELKNLRQLSRIAFELNPRFREVTTAFYLKLQGLRLDLGRDFLSEIERSPVALRFLGSV